jgi:hypothetical protein
MKIKQQHHHQRTIPPLKYAKESQKYVCCLGEQKYFFDRKNVTNTTFMNNQHGRGGNFQNYRITVCKYLIFSLISLGFWI